MPELVVWDATNMSHDWVQQLLTTAGMHFPRLTHNLKVIGFFFVLSLSVFSSPNFPIKMSIPLVLLCAHQISTIFYLLFFSPLPIMWDGVTVSVLAEVHHLCVIPVSNYITV